MGPYPALPRASSCLCSGIPVDGAQGADALSSIKPGSVASEGSPGTCMQDPPCHPHHCQVRSRRSCKTGTLPDLCQSEARKVTLGALLAQTGRPCHGGLGTLQGQEWKLFPWGSPTSALSAFSPAGSQPSQPAPRSMFREGRYSPAILPSARPVPACSGVSSSLDGHCCPGAGLWAHRLLR